MRQLVSMAEIVDSTFGSSSGYWKRLAYVAGIPFGLVFSLMAASALWQYGPYRALSWSIVIGVSCGVAFGCLMSFLLKWKVVKMARSIYLQEGRFAAPPPQGRQPQYRLPCSWKKSPRMSIGGSLYILPESLIFVPHEMNLPSDRKSVSIPREGAVEMELVEQDTTGWLRFLVPHPPPALRITIAESAWDFVVPCPEETLRRMNDALVACRVA